MESMETMDSMESMESMDFMESMGFMVIGDEKVEQRILFQKVVGIILDFMATFWDHGNGFLRRRTN